MSFLKLNNIFYSFAPSVFPDFLSLQNESVGDDALAEKVRRAADFIKQCREKLRQTEGDVQAALSDLMEL